MTQHMLLQAENPDVSNRSVVFDRIGPTHSFLAAAAAFLYPGTRLPVWKVSLQNDELDTLVTSARRRMHEGFSLEDTEFGRIIQTCIAQRLSFALFWCLKFDNLPKPDSAACFYNLMRQQILSEKNYELYLHWKPGNTILHTKKPGHSSSPSAH